MTTTAATGTNSVSRSPQSGGLLSRLRETPLAYRLGSAIIVLAIWEAAGPYIDPIFFSYPSAIAKAFYELTVSGELWHYAKQSIQILVYGLVLAIVIGVGLGLIMARFAKVDWTLDMYVNALYCTPMVALVPLLVLWLGIRIEAKVTVVFLFAVFPILINTYQGVKNVDKSLLEVARSFNSSERRMWFDVLLPSAVPYIAAGIRLALGRGLVGMIIAEFYTSISGLGYMVVRYAHNFEMDKTLVPVILLMTMGILFSELLRRIEARIAPWNRLDRKD